MHEKWNESLKSRNEEALIDLIRKTPGILYERDSSGASFFSVLGYHGFPSALEEAKHLKNDFDLYEAIIVGKSDLVKSILEHDISLLNTFSPDGFTPVALAAYFNREEIVVGLLEFGADAGIRANNASKVNALHAAVARNNVSLALKILESGTDVNSTQMQGITALHSAAHRGSTEMVKILLASGADKSLKMDSGETALDLATKDGHEKVTDLLKS